MSLYVNLIGDIPFYIEGMSFKSEFFRIIIDVEKLTLSVEGEIIPLTLINVDPRVGGDILSYSTGCGVTIVIATERDGTLSVLSAFADDTQKVSSPFAVTDYGNEIIFRIQKDAEDFVNSLIRFDSDED